MRLWRVFFDDHNIVDSILRFGKWSSSCYFQNNLILAGFSEENECGEKAAQEIK
jgi:hypothetical protein